MKSSFCFGNQLASVTQVLSKTSQTCKTFIKTCQVLKMAQDLHLDLPGIDFDLEFGTGSNCREKTNNQTNSVLVFSQSRKILKFDSTGLIQFHNPSHNKLIIWKYL